jgi:hypothetical protein
MRRSRGEGPARLACGRTGLLGGRVTGWISCILLAAGQGAASGSDRPCARNHRLGFDIRRSLVGYEHAAFRLTYPCLASSALLKGWGTGNTNGLNSVGLNTAGERKADERGQAEPCRLHWVDPSTDPGGTYQNAWSEVQMVPCNLDQRIYRS